MITNQYTYNGDGQRVQIVDSEGTKKPIWDMENILLETDGSNVTQVIYTLEPAGYGNLVSQRRASTTSFYLFDALGSARKLTSSAGGVTDSYDFRAYGETFASSGSTVNVFRWVGELGYYYDINRVAYYLRARPYSPAIARFLSQDPIGFEGSPWNLYEYVGSVPSNSVDPRGLQQDQYLECLALCRIGCAAEPEIPIILCFVGCLALCRVLCPPPSPFPCTSPSMHQTLEGCECWYICKDGSTRKGYVFKGYRCRDLILAGQRCPPEITE
jgi:RHS repeat-associated protein